MPNTSRPNTAPPAQMPFQSLPGPQPELETIADILVELESRHSRLRAELTAVETRLREVRTAADLCPECGGSGQRKTRGGLYGELQPRPCACREP